MSESDIEIAGVPVACIEAQAVVTDATHPKIEAEAFFHVDEQRRRDAYVESIPFVRSRCREETVERGLVVFHRLVSRAKVSKN